MTSHVAAQRRVRCPFSIAPAYAANFLRRFGAEPLETVIKLPFVALGLPFPGALKRKVRLRFRIQDDNSDTVRQHEAIRIVWWSESALLPNLSGTLRFRVAKPAETLLIFEGTYQPPFGTAGAIFDRFFGRHLATATARDLLVRIGDALEAEERTFRALHLDPSCRP